MRRLIAILLLVSTGPAVAAASPAGASSAQSPGQAAGARPAAIRACSLLTKAEVKKFVGAHNPLFDRFEPDEDAIGSQGSGCNYAGVYIQVNPFTGARLGELRKTTGKGWSAVPDVGDAAYFRTGRSGMPSSTPGAARTSSRCRWTSPRGSRWSRSALARALVAKLP